MPLGGLPETFAGNDVILALLAGRGGDRPMPSGSGVMIGPGVALTAKHVIDDYWDHFDPRGRWRSTADAPFSIQAIQYVPSLDGFFYWNVWAASLTDRLDIAVLQLAPAQDLPPEYNPGLPHLDLSVPGVGTRVEAFGFPFPDLEYTRENETWTLTHSPAGCTGTVTQVFPSGRDRTKAYPCYEMDLEIKGGMSGGPVFDSAGRLRGIVCSSFDLSEPGNHISYASALWPSFGMGVLATPVLGLEKDGTLLDVAKSGKIIAENLPEIEAAR